MHPKTQNKAGDGYSMIELLVASVLLSLMILAVTTLSISGTEAQEFARRTNRATEVAQEMVDDIRLEMVSSVRVFGNDAEGVANLALLDLAGAPPPLPGLRLPTVSANDTFRLDTAGDEITGNSLFFTKLAWSDRFVCLSGNDYVVDVYRWVYYYLTQEGDGPAAGSAIGLNIVRVASEPLVDGASIDRITDTTDQEEVLMHLANATLDASGNSHTPCQVVWQRGALPSVAGTLQQIDPSDGSLSVTPLTGRPDPWNILRAEQDVRGLLSYRHHSVATIYAQGSMGVGKYGVVDPSGSGFPHGFELQVCGPSSARQMLLNLVVASTQRRGHTAWSAMQVTIDARDL